MLTSMPISVPTRPLADQIEKDHSGDYPFPTGMTFANFCNHKILHCTTEFHPFIPYKRLPAYTRQCMCSSSMVWGAKRFSKYGLLLDPLESLDQAFKLCELASPDVMLYRVKGSLQLIEYAKFYTYLLERIYPDLECINLEDYVNTELMS